MNISMFFVFPGLLITIGVILLILSIVIIFIAYKSEANIEVDASLLTPFDDENSGININKRKINTNKHIYDSNLVEEQPAMREQTPKKQTPKPEPKENPVKEQNKDIFEEEFEEPKKATATKPVNVDNNDDDDIELL